MTSDDEREESDYYDPQRQNLISEHDCVFEDGVWWFGHGMPCQYPRLHTPVRGESNGW